jgi:hypothetical protein
VPPELQATLLDEPLPHLRVPTHPYNCSRKPNHFDSSACRATEPRTYFLHATEEGMSVVFERYLQDVQTELSTGIARERAYRPALKELLQPLEPNILATNEPRRSAVGAPDYVVARGGVPLGYIEAKEGH